MKLFSGNKLKISGFMKNQKGFTLLELIAVIAILGIIAAISFAAFSTQGEKARVSAHETNINTIEQAAERYNVEKGFRTGEGAGNEDFTYIDVEHSLVKEGYLKEEPKNPWTSTNKDQKNFKYIITKDKRGAFLAYLAEVNNSDVSRYVVITDKKEVNILPQGDKYNFVATELDENSPMKDRYYIGKP